jgi:phage host-nuclease inhibitor protein Gam
MGLVTKIGLWLDKRFPEKVSAEEVWSNISKLSEVCAEAKSLGSSAHSEIADLKERLSKVEALNAQMADQIKSVRDFAQIKSRVVPSAPNGQLLKTPPGIAR